MTMELITAKLTGVNRSIVRGSPKPIWKMVVDKSAATTGLANPVMTRTIPTANVFDTGYVQAASFYFGGINADGNTVNYQIIGWVPLNPGSAGGQMLLLPIILAKGVYTLSSMVMTTLIAASFVADTITDTVDRYGTIKYSPADNTPASLILDVRNCIFLTVETDLGTGATFAYVWAAPVDAPLPNADAT
ncbi:MAG TPA: hypothetical protein VNA25_23020 [Phycisphaerae bacterium]|nr:hypothetical protein [Phycisphaerae bacterium]